MKNKNFRKLKYVSGNPQNAGFCTIYPTASGGLGGPQDKSLHHSKCLFDNVKNFKFLCKILTFLLYILIICDFNFISSNNGTDNKSSPLSYFAQKTSLNLTPN
jgi:hypothetical protein